MKNNKWLYGEDTPPPIPSDVISKRVAILKQHLKELLAVVYHKRNMAQVNDVLKAIDFWQKLGDTEAEKDMET